MARRKPRNIVRIDIDKQNLHGWQVRVTRHHQRHTKFFSDSLNGGREGALQKAEVYRDDLKARLPDPLPSQKLANQARSTSGVPGIRLDKDITGKQPIPRIVAEYYNAEDGSRKTRSFSVRKWGLRRALFNAVQWKAQRIHDGATADQVKEMYDTAYATISKRLETFYKDLDMPRPDNAPNPADEPELDVHAEAKKELATVS